MKRILIIEREFGCGAGPIAEQAARRLGWRLWDSDLTDEIARLAKITPSECARQEERVDSWLYRLGKLFWRGSHETALEVGGPEILDADRMVQLVEQVVRHAAESAPCVIVGRGAPYLLRNRSDTFSVFLYAPREVKIRRLIEAYNDPAKAERLVDSVDAGRAAFIKHYYGKTWPSRSLYHLMINTVIGIDQTVEVLIQTLNSIAENPHTSLDLA